MTVDVKLPYTFRNSSALPVSVHGTGVVVATTPYRWIGDLLRGTDGTVVNSWTDADGERVLTGEGNGVRVSTFSGHRALAFDGTGFLSNPASSPFPSSRGTICGVARLSSSAAASLRAGLLCFSNVDSSPSISDGRITRESNGKMRFDRLGTESGVTADSPASITPGQPFSFGFTQLVGGAVAMLNGETFSAGTGDIQAFQRLFIGTIGSSVNWQGEVFEIDTWGSFFNTSHFAAFHAAMRDHYSFLP